MTYFLIFIFLFILIPAAFAGISGAPFVPANRQDIDIILKLADLKPTEKFYDLGAGDSRVILKAVQEYKINAVGIEIQPVLVLISKIKALYKGIKSEKLKIKWADFMKEDLKSADIIFFYLMPKAMPNLKKKLDKELKKGTRVISYIFPVSGWKEKKMVKSSHTKYPIYLYKI